jgi:uncharacterized membrane protein
MANLVVITFDNAEEAGKVREALLKQKEYISLDDSAVVVQDEEGKVHVKNQTDRGTLVGAVGGGVIGLLLGSVFFPLGGLLVGAVGGALVGRTIDLGIDQKFVEDVSEALQPGTSALFIIVREARPDVALATLKPFKGQVYHTSLSTDAEESLRRVLSERQ